MSGWRMLTTSRGGVFLTDLQGYHYYRKKETSAHFLYVCKEYKKVKSNCPCVVKHMKESNTYETRVTHSEDLRGAHQAHNRSRDERVRMKKEELHNIVSNYEKYRIKDYLDAVNNVI